MAAAQRQAVDRAFAANQELRKRVHAAIDQNPAQGDLFCDISTYFLNQSSPSLQEPASKKRKIDDGGAPNGTTRSLASTAIKASKTYPTVSFALPQRKKLTLELVSHNKDGGVRAVGSDGSVEFGIAWTEIDEIFCLPVPEKAKRQHNFVVIPVNGNGAYPTPDNLKGTVPDSIMWTYEEPAGKNIVEGEDPGPQPMADAINQCLSQAGVRKSVIFPNEDEFASAIPQSHRKGEKAFHVKAHRGSKEGYLFFTAVGLVWGFKKPIAFFDFDVINSVSYTNVLRNTFNLVINITGPAGAPPLDVEFGMIDQQDYDGINAYIQEHGLQDASMAAARRAKKLNINPPAQKENGAQAPADDNGETELEKAARILQEQEDEEEEDEDFEPESGESEGSGTDDSDDDEDGDGAGYEQGENGEEYDDGYDDEDEAMQA